MVRIKREERDQVLGRTRQALLDAAAEEFARQGYRGANINTISTAAGFAKGTVYNHFPSKQALLLALIDSIAKQHLDFIQAEVQPEADPARRLKRFFRAGFDFVALHPSRARVMLNMVYGSDEELKQFSYQAYQPMFQFVSHEILIPGIDQGIFRSLEPQSTAVLLMTIYLGTASQVDEQGRSWLDPVQVADFALNGLRS